MIKRLNKGKWSRPTDRSAVYIEIEPGRAWGLRITLIDDYARVEAVKGEKDPLYNAPKRYSTKVLPPTLFEKIRGISFDDKIMAEVANKRIVIGQENGEPEFFQERQKRN